MVRGANYKLDVTVTDKVTGDPVDCSGATGILLGLYQDGGKIIQKWSLVSKTGYDDIDMTDAGTGLLVVYVIEAKLRSGVRAKTLKFEGKIAFSDSDYPGGTQIDIDTDIPVEILEPSIFEGESPL